MKKLVLICTVGMAAAAFPVLTSEAQTRTLRIVSYNIDCADQNSDGNITNSMHSLPTVVQAIGLHHLGTNAQPMDVMSCEELNSTTTMRRQELQQRARARPGAGGETTSEPFSFGWRQKMPNQMASDPAPGEISSSLIERQAQAAGCLRRRLAI
jgi:hypothetical protein